MLAGDDHEVNVKDLIDLFEEENFKSYGFGLIRGVGLLKWKFGFLSKKGECVAKRIFFFLLFYLEEEAIPNHRV